LPQVRNNGQDIGKAGARLHVRSLARDPAVFAGIVIV